MEEIYKVCYENYEISNFGNCRKKIDENNYIVIKGSIQNRGYRYFQLQRNGKRKNILFHHMVAKCFIGERPDKFVIDHIDRDKLNNNVNNLRYITHRENIINSVLYRDDVKEKNPRKRVNKLCYLGREKVKEEKKYMCLTCPKITKLKCIFGSKRDFDIHMKGSSHIMKIERIKKMEENNIQVCYENYEKLKTQNYDYRRGRRLVPICIF